MNTTFNIQRFGLIIKRYFIENKQRELTFWGIVTIVFMLLRDNESIIPFLLISGYFVAAGTYKIFSFAPGGIHYLMIPATHLEKLVSDILIKTIYYFIAFIITYIIGTYIGIQLENFIFTHNVPVEFNLFNLDSDPNQSRMILWYIFYAYAIIQAVGMLGSLYFKRSAAMRTILTLIIVGIILFWIEMLLLKLMYGTYHLDGRQFSYSFIPGENLKSTSELTTKIIGYVTLPFLWIVSYFRLTEKEV